MNYIGEARSIADQFASEDWDIEAAKVYALLAIAEELQGIHEIMHYSDANVRKVEMERAADSSVPYDPDEAQF